MKCTWLEAAVQILLNIAVISQLTRAIEPTLYQCWTDTVFDELTALYVHIGI